MSEFSNEISDTEQAVWADNKLGGVENFPYATVFSQIDRGNPLAAALEHDPQAKDFKLAGEGMAAILAWIWNAGPHKPNAALKKLVALTGLLRPELLHGLNFREMAAKLGCTKASMSKNCTELRDKFGSIEFRVGRKKASRERMREARMAQCDETGHVMPRRKATAESGHQQGTVGTLTRRKAAPAPSRAQHGGKEG